MSDFEFPKGKNGAMAKKAAKQIARATREANKLDLVLKEFSAYCDPLPQNERRDCILHTALRAQRIEADVVQVLVAGGIQVSMEVMSNLVKSADQIHTGFVIPSDSTVVTA